MIPSPLTPRSVGHCHTAYSSASYVTREREPSEERVFSNPTVNSINIPAPCALLFLWMHRQGSHLVPPTSPPCLACLISSSPCCHLRYHFPFHNMLLLVPHGRAKPSAGSAFSLSTVSFLPLDFGKGLDKTIFFFRPSQFLY